MTKIIATHDGKFHADEVLAIALILVFVGEYKVLRSRDIKVLEQADILVDVGARYESHGFTSKSYYDHHHFETTHALYGLSSAGLVWKDLLAYGYLSAEGESEWLSIKKLVKEVDAQDTGFDRHGEFHFCNLIAGMNHDEQYHSEQMKAFHRAVEFAMAVIHDLLRHDAKRVIELEAANSVTMIASKGYRIALSAQEDPWFSVMYLVEKADFSITYDHGQNCWSVQTVPLQDNPFDSKFKLQPTGDSLEIFVHQAGFIGKYLASEDGSVTFLVEGDSVVDVKVDNRDKG